MPAGDVVFTGQQIKDEQNVWQSIGGQQLGSVWGHGAYVAPDWSADWLHRECLWLLDRWSHDAHGQPFAQLDESAQSALTTRLKQELRRNSYDPRPGDLTISADRAAAIDALSRYYAAIFGDATELADDLQPLADGGRTPAELRSAYAIPNASGSLTRFFLGRLGLRDGASSSRCDGARCRAGGKFAAAGRSDRY